jgi:recombination protein RecA
LDVGLGLDIVDKRGSYYYFEEENFAQGRENAKLYLKDNPEFADKIEVLIRRQVLNDDSVPEEEVTSAGADADSDGGGQAA